MTATDMKTQRRGKGRPRGSGFSVIELMVVVAMVTIVLAAILTQVDQVQQRATAEQGKVDDFQQARDFVDHVYNDTRQMGYPNVRNFDVSTGTWQGTLANDHKLAVGLVKVSSTQLEFQGDVDGSGTVSVVSYMVNGSGTCSACLERAQVTKVDGDAVTAQSNLTSSAYNTEVQNVKNTSAIFTAFDGSGNSIALPIDFDSNASTIPKVRTIQIRVRVANPQSIDPKTGQQLEADFGGQVQVVNCSMATTGLTVNGLQLSCQ